MSTNLPTRDDVEKDLWSLYGETVKAVRKRLKDDDCKPADIANAIKLLQNNSMSMSAPRELNANPQVIMDKLHALPFTDADYDEDE